MLLLNMCMRRSNAQSVLPLSLTVMLIGAAVANAAQSSPIQVEVSGQYASFLNRDHPDNRLGYRFHEHTPLTYGAVPKPDPAAEAEKLLPDSEGFKSRSGVKVFHRRVTEDGWIPQDWTFYLAPVSDGIEMLWVVKTEDGGLPEFYCVQQCFRLTGVTNEAWRQKYARTPAFSEFDLWKTARGGAAQPSLTSVLRDGSLQHLPAGKETVGCQTPYGEAFDVRRSGGHLDTLERVGPYQARMLWTSDGGLILSTSLNQKWSTGLYWERTTHLSDHHPADCLHAIVNIGDVAPHTQRLLRGKIYWLPGSGEALVAHWHKDFPGSK